MVVRDNGQCELCFMLKFIQHEVRSATVIRFSADLKGMDMWFYNIVSFLTMFTLLEKMINHPYDRCLKMTILVIYLIPLYHYHLKVLSFSFQYYRPFPL